MSSSDEQLSRDFSRRAGPKSQAQIEHENATGEQAPLTLYLHCVKAYEIMNKESVLVTQDAPLQPEDHGALRPRVGQEESRLVWHGFVTHLIGQQLHLSTPYHTKIMQALQQMGCIQQLKRGGGGAKSEWELLTPPTEEAFKNQTEVGKKRIKRKLTIIEQMQAQIDTLIADVQHIKNLLMDEVE